MPSKTDSHSTERTDTSANRNEGVRELVITLIKSFLRSDSDYGAITDINTEVDYVYKIVREYVNGEKLDVYPLALSDRVLLSKTNIGFEEIYEVIKKHSHLELKKNMIEVWDDPQNKIIHLIISPIRKHFPVEYSSEKEKKRTVDRLSSITLELS